MNRIKKAEEDGDKPVLIIDLTSVPYLDQTACKAFIEWVGSIDEKAHVSLVAPEGKYKNSIELIYETSINFQEQGYNGRDL